MNHALLSFLLPPVLCIGVATAQAYTLTDANATYANGLPATVTGPAAMDASACTTDHLYTHNWCYKIVGTAPPGRPFDDVGHVAYNQAPTPNTLDQTIIDVGSLGLINASIFDVVTSIGPQSGSLVSRLTVTNASSSPVTVKLYNYLDIDFNTSSGGDFTLPSSEPGNMFVVADANAACRGCMSFTAVTTPDFWQCNAFNAAGGAAAKIVAAADLADTGLPFSSSPVGADFVGAFQWNRTLLPATSVTVFISIVYTNTGVAGTNVNFGTAIGGPSGPPTLSSATTVPRIGREYVLDIGNAGTATFGTIMLGVDPAPTQVQVFGLFLMNAASGIIAGMQVPLAGGVGSFSVVIPPNLGSAGLSLCSQAFILDATSIAALPVAHSNILIARVGD